MEFYIADWFSKRESVGYFYARIFKNTAGNIQSWAGKEVKVFENEYSGAFFNSAWRRFRKRNAFPNAITQNVEYLLDSVLASTMLSNSEYIVMLNQTASDRQKLAELLNISNEQMSYITNADAGCGLIKYGSSLVPFINKFPKNTRLYKLMTTKPREDSANRNRM